MGDLSSQRVFVSAFRRDPAVIASAPGRVNLMGEHTDYHQGFVLPTVLPQRTTVSLRPRGDRVVRVVSAAMADGIQEFALGAESPRREWIDYIQGVTLAARTRDHALRGFDAAVTSDLPAGGGVSSSAALTVAVLRALRMAKLLDAEDLEIARLAQLAETDFVGAPVGIMDQMACSLGNPREALFIDTRSLRYERIAWPANAGLIVIDSGSSHRHSDGKYGERRRESFAAAEAIGVDWLRDVDAMPDGVGLSLVQERRARHVINENQRVLWAAAALRDGDLPRLGALFTASHRSQRDDYETSTPALDTLAAIAERDSAIFGARLTGGGFGGAVVMLADASEAATTAERILNEFKTTSGGQGTILSPWRGDSAKELE